MFKQAVLFSIIIPVLLAGCTAGEPGDQTQESTLETIRLPMGYIANVQYAPFYVAIEKGYYAQAGIEIEFDYSFETDGVALVGAGELPFAIVSGEQVLLARAQEIPVVYVMAWFQDYPIGLISKAETEIGSINDLKGRNIGLPGLFGASYIGLRALLYDVGIAEDEVQLESIGFNQVQALSADQVEVVTGYMNNEPVQLAALGYQVEVFRVADYVQLAANGIISNEATIEERPDLVQVFVDATLKGLADTLENPEEAFEISKKFVESLRLASEDELAVQREVLDRTLEFWQAETLGYSTLAAWENMQKVLLDMGLLIEPLDLQAAFTNDFIAE